MGVARVVEIDTTGGPGFGFEHFKSHLREGEVVLTFDDGPWPKNTPAVLAAWFSTNPGDTRYVSRWRARLRPPA
jgi:hypothetical protein